LTRNEDKTHLEAGQIRAYLHLLFFITLVGCDLGAAIDTADSFDPVIQVEDANVRVVGSILDSRTGTNIEEQVVLTFSGSIAHLVQDVLGHSVDRIVTRQGAASFAISNVVNPGPGQPIQLRIHASANGYRDTAVRLRIPGPGLHEYRLILDRLEAPLAAFADAVEVVTVVAGVLQQPLQLLVADAGSSTASLAIPAASVMSTDSRLAAEGSIEIVLTHSPPSAALFATLPGGMDAGFLSEDGTIEPATLTTGGLVEVSGKTLGGESWEGIEGGNMTITAAVDRDLFNPDSNERLRPGDGIEIHEWLPGKGVWRLHSETVVAGTAASKVVMFETARTGLFSAGYRTVHCASARLLLSNNSRGGALVAYRGSRRDSDGVRVWRFPAGAAEVELSDPPDFWRGTAYLQHGNQEVIIPYDGICGRTFEAELANRPPNTKTWNLDPVACVALRVTNLPTLAVAVQSTSGIPVQAPATQADPPYFLLDTTMPRDNLGRPVRIEASGPVGAGDTRLRLVLGGEVWDYRDSDTGTDSVLDISDFATDTGLCVDR